MSRSLIVDRNVDVPMRDGVVLRADVYRRAGLGPLPILLQRTPYGKDFTTELPFALIAAERGYAVVVQDTRGRWASDGQDYPFLFEKNDGYDTVEWAARQPWANGQVGMFGGSYLGYTQWAAAVAQPPALRTITPGMSFADPHALSYQGGALTLGSSVAWSLLVTAQMAIMRFQGDAQQKAQLNATLVGLVDGMAAGRTFRQLPLQDLPLVGRGGLVPMFAESLAHPLHDEFWTAMACPYDRVQIPVFQLSGWYDTLAGVTLRDFSGLRRMGAVDGARPARGRQKLLMGPWAHGSFSALVGELDMGLQADGLLVQPGEILLRWFDRWLQGSDNGTESEPPINLFVMGDNRWRTENEWPLARTQYTAYYFHSGGAANSLNGDGTLSPETPGGEPVDTFVYDPRNPVPTCGGALLGWAAAMPPGVYDQRAVETRPDVLVYTGEPLPADLEVTGRLLVHMWAATSAFDTDFTAKLVDVAPDGTARNVQDGIIRARYRQGMEQARPIRPGEVYEYVIDLSVTSMVFKAGHRLRVELASSNFPRFDRNPNTGREIGPETELRPATQTVLHDAFHPSHIVLPVIPR